MKKGLIGEINQCLPLDVDAQEQTQRVREGELVNGRNPLVLEPFHQILVDALELVQVGSLEGRIRLRQTEPLAGLGGDERKQLVDRENSDAK